MTAITTGLSALLYMCASGQIDKSDTIHYLIYDNTYDRARFTSTDANESIIAMDIASSLGYEIQFHGPYLWYCPPIYERTEATKVSFTQPDITCGNLNQVSYNALFFLYDVLAGTEVEVYPEGASCFSAFRSLGTKLNPLVKQLRPRLSFIKRKLVHSKYTIVTNYLGRT